jgi:hypothetical protein
LIVARSAALPSSPSARSEPMVRTATLYHGTTLSRAQAIDRTQQFQLQDTYFAMGAGNHDLAVIFARRASRRDPRGGGPAVVVVKIDEPAIELLRKNGILKMLPFDPEDDAALRLRSQWKLDRSGVPLLNRDLEEISVERV